MDNILPRYGWKKDPVDDRDLLLKYKPDDFAGLPTKVDLREHCSTVENQLTLGSCTANAAAGALEYLEIKNGLVGDKFENFSRLYVYYNMREIQGTLNEDSGGTMRDTMKTLAKNGACDELLWTYDIGKFKTRPTDECYADGENHKITEYLRLETLEDMVKCLAEGYPVTFGFMVYTNFEGPQTAKSGILEMPSPGEVCKGGHAVCAVGYDMDTKRVLVRNSWGEAWGQDGYFTMPFDYLRVPHLSRDFWTIRK